MAPKLQKYADGGFIPSRDMAGARKRQPRASGTGEKRKPAAHGASTEFGHTILLTPNEVAERRAEAAGRSALASIACQPSARSHWLAPSFRGLSR